MQQLDYSGITLERKTPDFVSVEERIRPLRDVIVVKPLPEDLSKTLMVVSGRRPIRGMVVAAGPGTYHWKYNHDRSKRWLSKQFTPCDVKVGDVVEIGDYAFPQILIGLEPHVLCREADVCGVVQTS